jgi:outer membrane receptor protein involved in Fe transport
MNKSAKSIVLGLSYAAAFFHWQQGVAQTASVAADSDGDTLQTIIITAQKRSEDVQSVPMSVTVVDQGKLDQLHATQLADYAGYIPGLQVSSNGAPGQTTLSLRGIPPLGSSATVATYIDDTPLGSSSLYGASSTTTLDLLPFDLQSVDVLRGPQGTLYGASALGGLIKYVTRAPDLNQSSVLVGGDTFAVDGAGNLGVDGRIRVSTPIIPGQLGVSASFSRQDTPGYIDNAQTGAKDQNSYSQQAARAALLWKPSDDLSLTLSALQERINADTTSVIALDSTSLQPIFGNNKNNNFVPEPFVSTLDYLTASLNWNLGWADFNSATSYSHTTSTSVIDATLLYGVLFPLFGAPAGISTFTETLDLYKTTQEFRLTSKSSDKFEWLVGAFYDYEDSQQHQVASAQALDGTSIAGLDPLAIENLPSSYREYAAFGDATYKFNSTVDITGGLRWARNDQQFTQATSGAIEPLASTPGASSQDVVTYSVSPRLHINADNMLYARVASGYQPGGPNVLLPGVPPTVAADTLTNYEVGVKSLIDDHRLLIDVAAFYIAWQKIQVGTTNGVTSYLINGGTARSEGLEFSSQYKAIDHLQLGLNAAYTSAILTQDVVGIGGLSGDSLPYTPKWAGSATADYLFALQRGWNARAGAGLRYSGDQLTSVTHSPMAEPLRSYSAVDLNADVADERWTFRLFVKNLANKQVVTNETQINNAATGMTTQVSGVPLQPRTVGVGFDARF